MKRASAALGVLFAVLAPGAARADGAFPNNFTVFAPADRPSRLVLATTFGLVMSDDNGASWYLVCEAGEKAINATLYQMGPPPLDALGAASPFGLSVSFDNACSWTVADGGIEGDYVQDFFFDPSNPMSLYVLVSRPDLPDGGPQPNAVFQTTDGGTLFPDSPWFTAPLGTGILSLESARSSPQTVYVSLFVVDQATPKTLLARTDNAGASWQQSDLSPALGSLPARIAAVDPDDPSRLYLRVQGMSSDSLAVVTDGGANVAMTLTLPTQMSGFLRRANGEVLVTTIDAGSFLSKDLGQTFQPWASNLHLRAVTERAGTLYLAGDNYLDGFAVGSTVDEGATVTPLMTFGEIQGLKACGEIVNACQATWTQLRQVCIPSSACPPPPKKSCGCGAAEGMSLALAPLLWALTRRRGRAV